jgi:hypothetical protein
MKYIFLLSFLLVLSNAYSQNFEGEIIYSNHFTSKTKNFTDEQLEAMIGSRQEYLIKGESYKSFLNGQSVTMQQYDYRTNRIYNKTPKSDTLYWFDASTNSDKVVSFELKKNAEKVLGNLCDVIIMKTQTGTTKIFYSSRYKIDSKIYENHHYSNWAFYVEKTQSLPLKTIVETNSFRMESTATEIKTLELGAVYFNIDSKTPIKKS